MEKVIIAFIVFLLFAKANAHRKQSWLTPSSFLILIYVFSLFMSILHISMNDMRLVLQDKYWGAALFMTIMLLVFIWPFTRFNEEKIETIKLPNMMILNFFSSFIIVVSFYSILYYIPTVINLLKGDLGTLRNALYAGELYVETGLFNTIASTSASLYVFAILLFFVYLSIGGHKNRLILLFIASLSEPIHVLTYIGRDGVVFWIFSFVFLFLLFKPYLHRMTVKTITKRMLVMGGVLLIPFMLITVGRFEDNLGVGNSIVSYLGQPFVEGTLYFGINNPPVSPGQSFPLYYEIIGQKMPEGLDRWEMGGTVSWVFGTFLKSLYQSLGNYFNLILCSLIIGGLFVLIFGKNYKALSFSKIFVYILYFQILSQGVFYFRQYTRGGNLFIILCFFFAFIFSLVQDKNNVKLTRVKE